MTTAWQPDAFQGDALQIGIGLAEAGIGLAPTVAAQKPPPVDFVYSTGWNSSFEWHARRQAKLIQFDKWREERKEKREFREMLDIYNRWRMAA